MLIVNADDFGLSAAINKGIIETIEKGVVNSVSLVASGAAFDEAVDFLKKNKSVKAGIHLTLIEEKPVLAPDSIKSLVGPDGRFFRSYKDFLLRYILGKIVSCDVEAELFGQAEKIRSAGIRISHCDSHQHIHLLKKISETVILVCKDYKIPRIRIVNEPPSLRSFVRFVPLCVMNLMSNRVRSLAAPYGIVVADRFFGFNTSMHVTDEIIRKAKAKGGKETVELMCHPGYNPKPGTSVYSHWNMDWDRERTTLLQAFGKM